MAISKTVIAGPDNLIWCFTLLWFEWVLISVCVIPSPFRHDLKECRSIAVIRGSRAMQQFSLQCCWDWHKPCSKPVCSGGSSGEEKGRGDAVLVRSTLCERNWQHVKQFTLHWQNVKQFTLHWRNVKQILHSFCWQNCGRKKSQRHFEGQKKEILLLLMYWFWKGKSYYFYWF